MSTITKLAHTHVHTHVHKWTPPKRGGAEDRRNNVNLVWEKGEREGETGVAETNYQMAKLNKLVLLLPHTVPTRCINLNIVILCS